jgi:peptidoglycan/LPS O-acetylase OafA/YrhL
VSYQQIRSLSGLGRAVERIASLDVLRGIAILPFVFWLIERPARAWRRQWQAAHELQVQPPSPAVEVA